MKVPRMRYALALAAMVFTAAAPAAHAAEIAKTLEVTTSGGIQVLNSNDTTFPETVSNLPVVGTVGYHISRVFAVEGEFGWVIPISQEVAVPNGGGGTTVTDRKTPGLLTYQANLVAKLPSARGRFTPYVVGGAGAITFLADDEADRTPRLSKSETAFALNFGVGTGYELGSSWALRADFRQFVAFPSDADAAGTGLAQFNTTDRSVDTFWMERGTVGLAYRF